MEAPLKGDVVVVPFPFSNLSNQKRRPALVVSRLVEEDIILCQITSKCPKDDFAVFLSLDDSTSCGLNRESYIRPNKVFTITRNLIVYKLGAIESHVLREVHKRLLTLLLE